MTDIITVGDLRDALARYPSTEPLRIMVRAGELEAVSEIRTLAGRVALVPTNLVPNTRARRR